MPGCTSLRRLPGLADPRIASAPGDGAQGRDRTADTVIFSHVLYQLSYLGPFMQRAECGRTARKQGRS